MGDINRSAHLCFSYVGRTDPDGPGKGQVVNLGSAECLAIGKILHETLHALGLKLSAFTLKLFLLQVQRTSTCAGIGMAL